MINDYLYEKRFSHGETSVSHVTSTQPHARNARKNSRRLIADKKAEITAEKAKAKTA